MLGDGALARRMSYWISERLLGPLKEEVDEMLEMGIIEPSKSEWCSPVVLVPKKDGTLRVCIDFRYLNSVSKFDSYPAPRIDELTERLGKAKYPTTIDLCKGYWQVPLSIPDALGTLPVHGSSFWTAWSSPHLPTPHGSGTGGIEWVCLCLFG